MHKNTYDAKTLNGNWLENRQTAEYDSVNDATSNTYLPNPCKHLDAILACVPRS